MSRETRFSSPLSDLDRNPQNAPAPSESDWHLLILAVVSLAVAVCALALFIYQGREPRVISAAFPPGEGNGVADRRADDFRTTPAVPVVASRSVRSSGQSPAGSVVPADLVAPPAPTPAPALTPALAPVVASAAPSFPPSLHAEGSHLSGAVLSLITTVERLCRETNEANSNVNAVCQQLAETADYAHQVEQSLSNIDLGINSADTMKAQLEKIQAARKQN